MDLTSIIEKRLLEAKKSDINITEQSFLLTGNFSEAKFDGEKRTAEVTVIQKGWSQNGFYYGEQALEDISNLINSSAKQVYLNHNKRTEAFEPRKTEDHVANNISAVVTEDKSRVVAVAKFFESGPNSWVYDRMKETPDTFGPSIVGKAKIREGEVDGRKGPIVESITYLHSYDMVASPAAGGKTNAVHESIVPTLNSGEYIHISEGLPSFDVAEGFEDADNDQQRLAILKSKMEQRKARNKTDEEWWDLQSAYTSELSGMILAHNDYEYMPIAERKKLITPLNNEFMALVSKIKLVPPVTLPTATKEQISEAVIVKNDTMLQITLCEDNLFEKNSIRTVVISEEEGITASIGKLNNSKMQKEVGYYQFESSKGWDETLVREWVDKNIETNNIKEGVELMFENLAELKEKNPKLYNKLIAEAKDDHQVTEQVSKWKDDSDELVKVSENLSTSEKEKKSLSEEKTILETSNADLKKENDDFKSKVTASRKKELILEVKSEVKLVEEFCSEIFNSTLDSIEFDSEKESEFKTKVTSLVEDRKTFITDNLNVNITDKRVNGLGPSIIKNNTVAESKVLSNEEFAKDLKG